MQFLIQDLKKQWKIYLTGIILILILPFLLRSIPYSRDELYSLVIKTNANKLSQDFTQCLDKSNINIELANNYKNIVEKSFKENGWKISNSNDSTKVKIDILINNKNLTLNGYSDNCRKSVSSIIPDWKSLLPALLAIIIALTTRRIIFGLFIAVWIGAIIVHGSGWSAGLIPAFKDYIWVSIYDEFNFPILLFTVGLVGMVNIINKAGGNLGIANLVSRFAQSARSTRLSAAILGLIIFFDDYANTIIVGITLKPLTDRFRISREKLSYLVDSTAAPVAGLAVISTWIGYEVGLLNEISKQLNLNMGGYEIFFNMIPFRFYCIFTLIFIFANTLLSRDYGSMYKAEMRAFNKAQLWAADSKPLASETLNKIYPVKGIIPQWWVAVIPVAVVLMLTFFGLLWDGSNQAAVEDWVKSHHASLSNFTYWRLCFENANSPFILMSASFIGSIITAYIALLLKTNSPDVRNRVNFKHAIAAFFAVLLFGVVSLFLKTGLETNGFYFYQQEYWKSIQNSQSETILILYSALALLMSGLILLRKKQENKGKTFGIKPFEIGIVWMAGAKAMVIAMSILILAWSIRGISEDLGTPIFLVSAIKGVLLPNWLPILTFIIASAISFATGTSWGTMGMLIPTIMPLAYHLGGFELLIITTGAVLDGAIFGDHCSPISDTTIMSSMASGCDLIDHTKTQLPYAITTMIVAGLLGYVFISWGGNIYLSYIFGFISIILVLLIIGKKVPPYYITQA